MLMKATAEDIKKYGEWAYSLALNPIKSGYPTYGDGIKTKADFLDAAKRAVAGETSDVSYGWKCRGMAFVFLDFGGQISSTGWILYQSRNASGINRAYGYARNPVHRLYCVFRLCG